MNLDNIKQEVLVALDSGKGNVGDIQAMLPTRRNRLDISNALFDLEKEGKVKWVSQPVGWKKVKPR